MPSEVRYLLAFRAISATRWSLALGFLCATVGCGGPSLERVESATQALEGGELDTETKSVFRLLVRADGVNGVCTGTLIAPNLILTARHCIADSTREDIQCGEAPFGEPYAVDRVLFSNDPEPNLSSTWYGVESFHVPPGRNDTCGFDVALAILAQNVPEAVTLPTEPRLDAPMITGEMYTAVGYGLSGDEAEPESFGRRLRLFDLEVACGAGSCPRGVADTEFGGGPGVCGGDSGGPALDTDGRVAGVVSRGADPCETPVYGDVASWASWIREIATQAADSGAYEAPPWLDPDAESEPGAEPGDPLGPGPSETEDDAPGLGEEGCSSSGSRPLRGGASGAFGVALALAAMRRRRAGCRLN